jgi:WD40 repeat protein/mono/diheme cytochrome c family protein
MLRPPPARFACCLALVSLFVPAARGADDLAVRARDLLGQHCGVCHGPGGSGKGGFDYVLDRDRLVARNQVLPGNPRESVLLQRIRDGEMPPPKRPALNKDEVALLERWIDAGAPAVAAAEARTLVTDAMLRRRIRADLENLEPRRRRFVRYLTLTHLANAGVPEEEWTRHRQALAKLVNSLSWQPRVTLPVPIDAGRTVYRIDLRDYKWTARQWDRLAAAYPYRTAEAGPAEAASGGRQAAEAASGGRQAAEAAALAGTARPALRGDWFVATASRPPYYHDFLQLPGTDRALERLLQVDVAANLQADSVVRAGFNGSGVARNNRVLERHDALHGAYWRSYDFSDNTGRQNVFDHPLGPLPGAGGFQPAGGEIIFHLPNGLQGYLLVDGQGRRVDKAPGDIVSDPKRPDRLVENGLSCLGCHFGGLLPKDDQVRAHVLKNPGAFSREDREAVLALYPPAARLRALVKEDNTRFARALAQAGTPPGEPEPIAAVVLRYEAVLDLGTAAAEAGLAPDDFVARLRRASALGRTLGPLLARGGTVQRQVFEDAYPEMARAFRLGEDGAAVETAWGLRPFAGHQGSVRDVVISPDGRRAASAGEDKVVLVWDIPGGGVRQRLVGHSDEVLALAFAADGKRLLSGGRDRTLRLWDVEAGREVRRLGGHTDAVRAVAFSPDGRLALSGGDDRTLRLWDLESGKELHALAGHGGAVTCIAFSPDGRLALSGSADRTLRLWDVPAGRARATWKGHTGTVSSVVFAPDGRQALSGGEDGVLRLWDAGSGKEVRRLEGHANAVIRVAFAGGGHQVLSGSSRYQTPDRVVRRWDLAAGREGKPPAGDGPSRVECAAFSADGRFALLGVGEGKLRLWVLGD